MKLKSIGEIKTSAKGAKYAELESDTGEKHSYFETKKLPISSLKVGEEYELEAVANGDYVNWKASKSYKSKQMEDMIEKKNTNINHIMDRKEMSIILTSSARDATLMMTALKKDDKKEWLKWRNFFLGEYMKNEQDLIDPLTNKPYEKN